MPSFASAVMYFHQRRVASFGSVAARESESNSSAAPARIFIRASLARGLVISSHQGEGRLVGIPKAERGNRVVTEAKADIPNREWPRLAGQVFDLLKNFGDLARRRGVILAGECQQVGVLQGDVPALRVPGPQLFRQVECAMPRVEAIASMLARAPGWPATRLKKRAYLSIRTGTETAFG